MEIEQIDPFTLKSLIQYFKQIFFSDLAVNLSEHVFLDQTYQMVPPNGHDDEALHR